jgi:YHS domain-containing protein
VPDVKALFIDVRVEGFFLERFNNRGELVGTTQHETMDEAMWQADSEYEIAKWRSCPEDVDPVEYIRGHPEPCHGAPSVRVGMHHGPAIARNGDYIGATVNLAARISGAASGGGVLLAAETAALAPLIEGVLYESRGRQALRNVRDPIELVAAVRHGHPSQQGLAIDPVCQMAVDPERAAGRLNYNDSSYFFCTLACAGEFARHPERFMS